MKTKKDARDTGRTSSQGRKFSTGGDNSKRGDPQVVNDNAKATETDLRKPRKRRS